MSEKISKFIVDTLIDGKIISDSQRQLYEYCFNTILEIIISIISAVIIGITFRKLTAVIIFMAVFFPLRTFCGGFHCETSRGCYIMSMVFLIAAIWSYPYLRLMPQVFFIIAAIINFVFVIFLSPVVGRHKHISTNDNKRMKITSLIITLIIYVLEIFLYISSNVYFYLIALTVLLSLISMIIGKIVFIYYRSACFLDHSQDFCQKSAENDRIMTIYSEQVRELKR